MSSIALSANAIGNVNASQPESPSTELARILGLPHNADPTGPRFLAPTAPARRSSPGSRFKKAVNRMLGVKEPVKDEKNDAPLIPAAFSKGNKKPMAAASTRPASPFSKKAITAALSAAGRSLIGRRKKSIDAGNGELLDYSLSMDELAGGLAAAPPSPTTTAAKDIPIGEVAKRALEENYKKCMRHERTIVKAGVPDLQGRIVSAMAEDIDVEDDDNRRIFIIPLADAGDKHFLQPRRTRLNRAYPRFSVRSLVVSRAHAEVFMERSDGSRRMPFIQDCGSSGGTFVNGQRMAPAGTVSSPLALNSGDIIQLGCDQPDHEVDENDERTTNEAIQFVVLIGTPRKTKTLKIQETDNNARQGFKDGFICRDRMAKLYKRALANKTDDPEDPTARLYIEYGDWLHDNSYGHGLLARTDGPCYAAHFNNYKLTWEASIRMVGDDAKQLSAHQAGKSDDDKIFAITDAEGRKVAKVNIRNSRRVIVQPTSETRPMLDGKSDKSQDYKEMDHLPVPDHPVAQPYIILQFDPNDRTAPPKIISPIPPKPMERAPRSYMISKPEIPYYTIEDSQADGRIRIIKRDRNDGNRERLLGAGGKKTKSIMRWGGKQSFGWEGDLLPCADDMLIVLAMLMKSLVERAD